MNQTTVGLTTRNRCLAACALQAFIGCLVMAGAVEATPFWGTTASGIAREFEITCGTCPNPVTVLSKLSDGGFANSSANVTFSNPGLVSYFGTAVLTGPNSLPHLGALAAGNVVTVAPSTFFYAASAEARATQMYTYTGSTATDYTIEYNIDGAINGGNLTEIAGGFTVFGSGFNPGQEVQPVLGFSFDHQNGDGTEKPVHLSGNVTFAVNPGDIFFVQATLEAIVDARSESMAASADASHTLEMSFTQGDTSLLIPAATTPDSSVPEPASLFPTAIGVAVLVIANQNRNRRPS